MPEIHHQSLLQFLKEIDSKSFAPVFLIYGEDFLYEQTVKHIVDAIIPDISKQRIGHEIIRHQESSQIIDIIEKLNTYAFFNQKKIIELRDSNIFVSTRNQGKLISKIKKAYDNSDMNQATKYYLELLGRLDIDLNEICDENIISLLGIESDEFQDIKWLLAITVEAQQNSQVAAPSMNDSGLLEKALHAGFPRNNHLIISTDTVDKRSSLYQAIKKIGVIIDCTVSKGSRKADKDIQRQTLVDYMNRELKKYRKEMDSDAFELFYEKIGFDIRNFAGCLEKVMQYVGDRKTIHLRDVEAVSHPVRQDPIYELTGAISERNTEKSIYYLSSLLDSRHHPLQILTAMTNQIRRLLIIKGFLKNLSGNIWRKGIRFDEFQNDLIPLMRKFDEALLSYLEKCGHAYWEKSESESASSKKSISSDLLLLKKDQHPYAVYILFNKTDKFSEKELSKALMDLSQADAAMKTTGQRPKSILEEMIIKICRSNGL
jgi:DNA polymerase III subunit delta